MEHQTPDPVRRSLPSQGARVEDDFVRRITPLKNVSPRRVAASLPFAIVAILVVATVAFGATVVRPMVISAMASATPVVVGDDPDETDSPVVPTASPTDKPTTAPTTAPTGVPTARPTAQPSSTATSGTMRLTAKLDSRKVVLTWTVYSGADFAYYKVVRSSDNKAAWPLGSGDVLAAAISDRSTLTFTDCPTAGKTWSYQVFAVKSANGGYIVLDSTNLVTIAVPAAPKPTSATDPTDLGALHVVQNSDGTYTFAWAAYSGDIDFTYYKLDGQAFPAAPGYVENGGHYWSCLGTGDTSVTIKVDPGTWNVNVEAVYFPGGTATAVARTDTLKLVVASAEPPAIGLTATVGDDGFAHLSWDKYTGDGFQKYVIARVETGTPSQLNAIETITDVSTTSWVDKSVQPGHKYYYRVLALSSSGAVLAQSPVIKVRIPAAATPVPTTAPTAAPSCSSES